MSGKGSFGGRKSENLPVIESLLRVLALGTPTNILYLCSIFVLDIKAAVPFSGTAAFFVGSLIIFVC
jgi:hypothetical protein